MSSDRSWVIEQLASSHNRNDFTSGNEMLDGYLKRQATQDIRRNICRVYVLTTLDAQQTVWGFYTLSTGAIKNSHLPTNLALKLPRHPVPVALLGRLAVRQNSQGLGLGSLLLTDAIKRTLAIADEIGVYALVVDAFDDKVKTFYEKFGFIQFRSKNLSLLLQLKSIRSV